MIAQDAILGAWLLESFTIFDKQDRSVPWGQDVQGLLIYSGHGYMSVSIRKVAEPSESFLDSILFYSARYWIEGDALHHAVMHASNPERIGKVMIRHASFDADRLVFTTYQAHAEILQKVAQEAFAKVVLTWKRAPQAPPKGP